MKNHRFPWNWRLRNLHTTTSANSTVFTCFSGGGGSSMGYKLAGFNVIGCNEIDKNMASCYVANLAPPLIFCEPIQNLVKRKTFPDELFNLDILDGSPPCSSFSISGNREKDWGKKRKFKEGQTEQILDTLFFNFIELGKRLQPKVIVAENVPALAFGKAKTYLHKILISLGRAGYYVKVKVLDASKMGVPQARQRLFFICIRKDLAKQLNSFIPAFPKINLSFNEPVILFKDVRVNQKGKEPSDLYKNLIQNAIQHNDIGLKKAFLRLYNNKCAGFSCALCHDDNPCSTILANPGSYMFRVCDRSHFTDKDIINVSTFPQNYNFLNRNVKYICGMSVPPVMMAQLATRIKEQWLEKLKR